MGRVADTKQAGPRPFAQTIDRDRQKLDVVPIPPCGGAVAQERRDCDDVLAESRQTSLLDCAEGAFGNHIRALPIIPAVQSNQNPPCTETAETFIGVA